MAKLLSKIFGSRNDRLLKRMSSVVDKTNSLEAGFAALTDQALHDKTDEFRKRVADGEPIDALIPEAFANVREAGRRVLKMRHFDVQLIGGMVLHQGN